MPEREKMSIEHRAKQFLPFTALTELEIAIEEKNKQYYRKLENSRYNRKIQDLKKVIEKLEKNHCIEITFSDPDETVVVGKFKEFNPLSGKITIGDKNVPVESIKQIRAVENKFL